MKSMNIPVDKIRAYKHMGARNRVFMTSQRLNMDELAKIVYLVNLVSQKVGL